MSTEKDLFVDKSAAALDEEARKLRRTKDYTAEVNAEIPKVLAGFEQNAQYQDAINALLALEKKARLANDVDSTSKVARVILHICMKARQWGLLVDQLTYIIKCRNQLIAVMKAAVSYTLSLVKGQAEAITIQSEKLSAPTSAMTDDQAKPASTAIPPSTISLDFAEQMELLTGIIAVAEGRLCVEYEHATATVMKANMLYSQKTATSKKDAYALITTIPAEVVGSMSYYEKCCTILNQVSLGIENADFIQAGTLLKKVRLSELSKYGELKYFYHVLLAQIHFHNKNWLECARAYYAIFLQFRPTSQQPATLSKPVEDDKPADKKTDAKKGDKKPATDAKPVEEPIDPQQISTFYGKGPLSTLHYVDINTVFAQKAIGSAMEDSTPTKQKAGVEHQLWLQRAIIAGALAPHDYESQQLLELIATHDQYVGKCGAYETVLKQLLSKQIISWPIQRSLIASFGAQYPSPNGPLDLLPALQTDLIFTFSKSNPPSTSTSTSTSMSDDVTKGVEDEKWTLLRKRVIQHNIRILSTIFTQVTFKQAAGLLSLDIDELERQMVELPTPLSLDRRAQVVNFVVEKDAGLQALSTWADDLAELFKLVENTEQFIQKARTVHQNQSQKV